VKFFWTEHHSEILHTCSVADDIQLSLYYNDLQTSVPQRIFNYSISAEQQLAKHTLDVIVSTTHLDSDDDW